jgi:hypothetical protein
VRCCTLGSVESAVAGRGFRDPPHASVYFTIASARRVRYTAPYSDRKKRKLAACHVHTKIANDTPSSTIAPAARR